MALLKNSKSSSSWLLLLGEEGEEGLEGRDASFLVRCLPLPLLLVPLRPRAIPRGVTASLKLLLIFCCWRREVIEEEV